MKPHNDSRTLKAAGRKKAQAALALAVSLWMAGGSLASAGQTTTIAEDHDSTVYGNHANGNVQSVDNPVADTNGNIVNMIAGKVGKEGEYVSVLGAFCDGSKTSASGNQVTVSGGKITHGDELAGAAAYNVAATLTNNTVKVTGSANIDADIDGAVTKGMADSNHVIIEDGTVNKDNGTGHNN